MGLIENELPLSLVVQNFFGGKTTFYFYFGFYWESPLPSRQPRKSVGYDFRGNKNDDYNDASNNNDSHNLS